MGALELREGNTVRCIVHGGEFQVLFRRYAATSPVSDPDTPPLLQPGGTPLAADKHCVQHTHLQATGQCQSCGAFMCDTCVFDLPGGIKICPACAAAPKPALSPKRKKYLVSSFVLAGWCTLVLGALMSGAFKSVVTDKESEQALGVLLMFILLVPSIVGLALGLSSMERRMGNTLAMWIATVWNGIILGGFLLLIIIGLLIKGGTQ